MEGRRVKLTLFVTRWLAAVAVSVGMISGDAEVAGAAHQPLQFGLVTNVQLQQPVEQQSDYPFEPSSPHYVVNPTQCSWDVDDSWQRLATDDYLDAGASVTLQTCLVS